MRALKMIFVAVAGLVLSGCGYNTIQTQDEQVKSAWSEVVNQYQRRADLIPNLVSTVRGAATSAKPPRASRPHRARARGTPRRT